MSARKARRARQARAPKPVNVDGHLLPPELHEKFVLYRDDNAARSARTNPNRFMIEGQGKAEADALYSVLWEHRPSVKAKDQCFRLCRRLMELSSAVGSAGDYVHGTQAGGVRAAGCALLEALAGEASAASMKLQRIAEAIAAEQGEKLQDWVARTKAIEAPAPPGAA